MNKKLGYADLQDHLIALDEAGLLLTIDAEVNKELAALFPQSKGGKTHLVRGILG